MQKSYQAMWFEAVEAFWESQKSCEWFQHHPILSSDDSGNMLGRWFLFIGCSVLLVVFFEKSELLTNLTIRNCYCSIASLYYFMVTMLTLIAGEVFIPAQYLQSYASKIIPGIVESCCAPWIIRKLWRKHLMLLMRGLSTASLSCRRVDSWQWIHGGKTMASRMLIQSVALIVGSWWEWKGMKNSSKGHWRLLHHGFRRGFACTARLVRMVKINIHFMAPMLPIEGHWWATLTSFVLVVATMRGYGFLAFTYHVYCWTGFTWWTWVWPQNVVHLCFVHSLLQVVLFLFRKIREV